MLRNDIEKRYQYAQKYNICFRVDFKYDAIPFYLSLVAVRKPFFLLLIISLKDYKMNPINHSNLK